MGHILLVDGLVCFGLTSAKAMTKNEVLTSKPAENKYQVSDFDEELKCKETLRCKTVRH